jgi:hypothetical protein
VSVAQKLRVSPVLNDCLLDSQTFAALGAACVDHSTAATGLHADQEAMGTRTANFGRLVSAFHFEILGDSARKYVLGLYNLSQLPARGRSNQYMPTSPRTIRETEDYRKFS